MVKGGRNSSGWGLIVDAISHGLTPDAGATTEGVRSQRTTACLSWRSPNVNVNVACPPASVLVEGD
jgi:hypothetical protein